MNIQNLSYYLTLVLHNNALHKKVHVVKAIRDTFDMSLKDAKHVADTICYEGVYLERDFIVNPAQLAYATAFLLNSPAKLTIDQEDSIIFTLKGVRAIHPDNSVDISTCS